MEQSAKIKSQKNSAVKSEMDGKYLTFFTDNQLFGVPIADVIQIVGMQNVTEVPEFPHYAKGIINLRGTIIPVIDVRLRLGKSEKAYDERTCIIVTTIQDKAAGFIVDAVDAVSEITNGLISPPPRITGNSETFLSGIAKLSDKIILLLNSSKLLTDEMFEELVYEV